MRFARTLALAAVIGHTGACGSGDGTGSTPPPPPPPPPAPTASISVAPQQVELGGAVTITWACTNATEFVTSWAGPVTAATGTHQVTPTQTGTVRYSLACGARNGAPAATAFANATVINRPQISVQIFGAVSEGYGPTTGLRLLASSGNWKDSVGLSASGFGSIPMPSSVQGSSEVCLSIQEIGASLYKDSNACVTGAVGDTTVFVLIPERWDIASGIFLGQSFPISMERATRSACDGLQLFPFMSNGAVTINNELPVAFDRASSAIDITPTDSSIWWSRIHTIRDLIGLSWFRPAMMGEVTATYGIRFIVNHETTGSNIGLAGTGGTGSTGLQYGFVAYRNKEVLSTIPNLLIHEFIHAAGFGHTGPLDWLSVLHSFACTTSSVTEHLTAEDVAYIQLWYQVKKLVREKNGRFDIRAAMAGEKGEYYRPTGTGSGLRSTEVFNIIRN